jgi:probable H4MPT-linked C1 transfer pathway protein
LRVLGLDIGGAYIKAGVVQVINGKIDFGESLSVYNPIWRIGKEKIPEVLQEIYSNLISDGPFDGLGVSITAELSDVFISKKEGIEYVVKSVNNLDNNLDPMFSNNDGRMLGIEEAIPNYLSISGSNWASTAKILAQIFNKSIFIDIGSSTADIIPIINHEIASLGLTDTRRLATGELVYTGVLRSNIPSIVHSIPISNEIVEISSEVFALTADVHLIEGNISETEYTVETMDGRGKSKEECITRIVRTICADPEMLTEQEISEMVQYIYSKQIEKVRNGIDKVWKAHSWDNVQKNEIHIITAGLGGIFLAKESAKLSGFSNFTNFNQIFGLDNAQIEAAISVALNVILKMGGRIDWPVY